MRRRGSVLLYVVWVMLLLSLFASSVGSRSLFALDTAQRLTEQLRAAYVARAGARLAAAALAEDQTATVDGLGEPWAHNPGRFKDHPFGGGTFRIVGDVAPSGAVQYGLTDEERRLNVNTASAEALQRLLEVAGGLRDNEAQALAEAILDWRDPDDDQRPSGAEGFYYRSLAHGYDCKDGPFEHVEELRLLRGMTPQLYERLAPHVTVFGAGPVNVNTAGRTVLQALGLGNEGISGLLAYRDGEDLRAGTPDDRSLVSVAGFESELKHYLSAEDLSRLARLAQERQVGVGSQVFRAAVEAWTDEPTSRVRLLCVMRRDGSLLFWAER